MASTSLSVRHLQRKLYIRSKQQADAPFYSLYDKICRNDVLNQAYQQCKANKGAAGVDGVTFERLENTDALTSLLDTLQQELKAGSYKPQPVKRVEIQKENGKTRCLGIPCIRDRIVQAACVIVLSPIFEPHLHVHSYGYRPKKSAQQAVVQISSMLKQGYTQVYDADLSQYFDTIPHDKLMEKVQRRVTDSSLLKLIKACLKSPISIETAKGKRRIEANNTGTPQGGVLSPLLANIFLNDFCLLIDAKTPCEIISYADDFVILAKAPFTKEQKDWFTQKISNEGLTLNQAKTHVVNMEHIGAEFDFLGFTFKHIKGFYRHTKYIKCYPSKKSQHKFKEKIREIVKHRTSHTTDVLIQRVNRIIRGWKNYFGKVGYPRKVFFMMDWFVVKRFYLWSRSRSQRRSVYLAQDAWEKLYKAGLVLLQPTLSRKL